MNVNKFINFVVFVLVGSVPMAVLLVWYKTAPHTSLTFWVVATMSYWIYSFSFKVGDTVEQALNERAPKIH